MKNHSWVYYFFTAIVPDLTKIRMRKTTSGFTLIELVVVITILGILAALALPRFAALQTEARIAKMNAALGSIKAGAALAHSLQLTQQLAASAQVTMEGATIGMANGYPTAASIGLASGLTSGDYVLVASGTTLTVTPDATHTSCSVTYTESAAAGTAPVYGNAGSIAANCQ